jgi:hypothetical protein
LKNKNRVDDLYETHDKYEAALFLYAECGEIVRVEHAKTSIGWRTKFSLIAASCDAEIIKDEFAHGGLTSLKKYIECVNKASMLEKKARHAGDVWDRDC